MGRDILGRGAHAPSLNARTQKTGKNRETQVRGGGGETDPRAYAVVVAVSG